MRSTVVNITRHGTHYRVQFAIDGKIQPGHVFGCREGMTPLITSLLAAESDYDTIPAGTELSMADSPPVITIGMPSGRALTFTLSRVEHTLTDVPKTLAGVIAASRGRDPVHGGHD